MRARAEAFLPVEKQAQESRLQEESEHALHAQRLADHASGKARKVRPVRAKLKLHGDSGDYAQHKVDAENPRPETRRLVVGLVVAAQAKRLKHDDQRRQTPRELRKEIVEGNGECEMNAMNQKRTIHVRLRGTV